MMSSYLLTELVCRGHYALRIGALVGPLVTPIQSMAPREVLVGDGKRRYLSHRATVRRPVAPNLERSIPESGVNSELYIHRFHSPLVID